MKNFSDLTANHSLYYAVAQTLFINMYRIFVRHHLQYAVCLAV